jgi:hypothetical protein
LEQRQTDQLHGWIRGVRDAGDEGTLSLAPGTTVKVGFALQLPGNKTHFNALINTAKAVFPDCLSCRERRRRRARSP